MNEFQNYFAPRDDKAEVVVKCDEDAIRELEAYNSAMRTIKHDYQSRMKVSYEKARGFCFSR